MIDIENLIITKVNTALAPLKQTYPKLKVTNDYVETSATFPLVTVVESDNYTHLGTQDADLEDHAVNIAYEINVYANDTNMKTTAKRIASAVDAEMLNNLFTRTFMGKTPNVDRTIYRITMRYTAVVAAPVTDGEDITFQMYRV